MQFGKDYENVAKQKFFDYLTFVLKRNVMICETGLVVQPYLFWLGASPDGLLICDNCVDPSLIEIKCPYTKRHITPADLLKNEKFYVFEKDGVTYLKKDHEYGYFSQVQLAMGLSQIRNCYFIVYTYKGLIVTHVEFDESYFVEMVKKLNTFYRNFFLPIFYDNIYIYNSYHCITFHFHNSLASFPIILTFYNYTFFIRTSNS